MRSIMESGKNLRKLGPCYEKLEAELAQGILIFDQKYTETRGNFPSQRA